MPSMKNDINGINLFAPTFTYFHVILWLKRKHNEGSLFRDLKNPSQGINEIKDFED